MNLEHGEQCCKKFRHFLAISLSVLHGKDGFIETLKNLVKYKLENNFVEPLNNYTCIGISNMIGKTVQSFDIL